MNTAVHITWHGAQINFGDLTPYLTYDEYWACICKLLRSSGIDSKESITSDYVAWARICKPLKDFRNRFPAGGPVQKQCLTYRPARATCRIDTLKSFPVLLKRLQIRALAGQYDNPVPTWFLAPIDCSKIPAPTCLEPTQWLFSYSTYIFCSKCRSAYNTHSKFDSLD